MTWNKEVSARPSTISPPLGMSIQFRIDAVTEFKPGALLAGYKLTFTALSSGEVPIYSATQAETIEKHVANAKFVEQTGGLYLQVLDQLKPYPRTVTPEECKQLGKLLTEIGKRTADLGCVTGSSIVEP